MNKGLQKLAYKQNVALSEGFLISGDDDFVPASIDYKNKNYDVKLRLKGDIIDHLESDKWSLRVKVRGDETLAGMKEFSLQHPQTRNYLYEWLFHKALAREGILSLRFYFVDVWINDEHKGIYALEEHFDKRMIENNSYRDGPIIRVLEDFLWVGRRDKNTLLDPKFSEGIDSFQSNELMNDSISREQFLKAKDLFESFREGRMSTSDVFDVEKMARFMALVDVLGASHATYWNNMRLYYNPVTSRLEPVGYDSETGTPLEETGMTVFSSLFYKEILDDMSFYTAYLRELDRVSEKKYLDDLFGEMEDELELNEAVLKFDYPTYNFSRDVFYSNQEYIKKRLNPVRGINAYLFSLDEHTIRLEVGNIQQIPVEILGVMHDGELIPPDRKLIIEGQTSGPIKYFTRDFVHSSNGNLSSELLNAVVVYRLLGQTANHTERIIQWPHISPGLLSNDPTREDSNLDEFEFIVTDTDNREIFFRSGNWLINRSIIIPPGYSVYFSGNSLFDLRDNALVLSYSPLRFEGDLDNPLVITSSDSTGSVVVLNAGGRSVLHGVVFSNLSVPDVDGWGITGPVSFYQSPVEFRDCIFSGNKGGDDMLNIIRSTFRIDNCFFRDILSDCLDVDFGRGLISGSRFMYCGGDGLDFSGSVVSVSHCRIVNSGDKAVSCGEGSNIKLDSLYIEDSWIGVAGKDLSSVSLNNVTISNCSLAITAYQKKPEYGPSNIKATNITLSGLGESYLLEEGSGLLIDGKNIKDNEKNVYSKLYCH